MLHHFITACFIALKKVHLVEKLHPKMDYIALILINSKEL